MKDVLEPPAGCEDVYKFVSQRNKYLLEEKILKQRNCKHRTGPNGKPFCTYCGVQITRDK